MPINQVLTRYADNISKSNLVIDLMFFQANLKEIDTHIILQDLWSFSNHAPLTVNIIIREEFIQDKYQTIIKNSEEEKEFVNELKNKVGNIDVTNISDSDLLEKIMQEFTFIVENLWAKYSKCVNITKCSKAWLNEECNRELSIYCYDLRLGLGCNLGKDLRKDRNGVQLVKHKDYRVVSILYI